MWLVLWYIEPSLDEGLLCNQPITARPDRARRGKSVNDRGPGGLYREGEGEGKGAENKHLQLDRNNGDRDSPEIEAVIGGNSTRKEQVKASGRGRVAKNAGLCHALGNSV